MASLKGWCAAVCGRFRWAQSGVALLIALGCFCVAGWAHAATPEQSTGQAPGAESRGEVLIFSGVERLGNRDATGSPLAYRGQAYPLILRWGRTASRWSRALELGGFTPGFNGGRLSSAIDDGQGHWANASFVDASFQWRFALLNRGGRRLELGPRLSHWTMYRSYQYDPAQIGSVEVWDAFVSLDASAGFRQTLGGWGELHLGINVPLGGYVMRPSYAVRGDERVRLVQERWRALTDGRFESWGSFRMVQTRAELWWKPGKYLGVVGAYRGGAFSYELPLDTRTYSHRFSLGVGLLYR
ncbi:hypothetical protein FRC98_03410 [Lujinxingia vulgaris]|uniref:Outer membrane protein beta-barrel domain-containing protein n=1 Tax=Lujinxingia vulgaris TaxID=2600176 RepID=A0A5C6XC04_9DELT|nr:hypothetical protein [Lujinxingia vulgaris]TXD39457.1 hypothetical protein FRC98_03410 [Lujinxingia vulgaris]